MKSVVAALPALLGGFLLYLADYPNHYYLLQLVAFLPLLFVLERHTSRRDALIAGGLFSLGFAIPTLWMLSFGFLASLFFFVLYALYWALFALGARLLIRRPFIMAAFGLGAWATMLEWLICTIAPVWGTAQSFTKVWSVTPWLVSFAAYSGMFAVAFVVVSLQTLLYFALRNRSRRKSLLAASAALVALLIVFGFVLAPKDTGNMLKVAAIGWKQPENNDVYDESRNRLHIDTRYKPLIGEAAARGARLIVTPEFALRVKDDSDAWELNELREQAKERNVWLGVGYFNEKDQRNYLAFINPEGQGVARYAKNHLIAFLETYTPGDGDRVRVLIDGVRVGGMICQDDNFNDLAGGYARENTQVMAVPTNDWAAVKDHHFENSRFRAIEYRYAIVRAALSGISAIIAPDGRVLDRMDHVENGAGIVLADVPVGEGGSPYSRFGNWFVGLCALLVLGTLIRRPRPDLDRHAIKRALAERGARAADSQSASLDADETNTEPDEPREG